MACVCTIDKNGASGGARIINEKRDSLKKKVMGAGINDRKTR